MPITTVNGRIVIEIPEDNVYQDLDPATAGPWSDTTKAQAWEAAYDAAKAAQQAAAQKAQQAALAAQLTLALTLDKSAASVNTAINVTATLTNGLGQQSVTELFAVPIEDDQGQVVMVKGVQFTNGAASLALTLPKSGYYRITERGLNAKLSGISIKLAQPVEVTIYE